MAIALSDILSEAYQGLRQYWFIQSLQMGELSDQTLSLRLLVRQDLFVQVFVGEISGSLYLALIENNRRIFGMDCEGGKRHLHPFGHSQEHQPLTEPPQGLSLCFSFWPK
jgi:hypothetical protein